MTFDVGTDRIGVLILIALVGVSTWATLALADACGPSAQAAPAVSRET